MSEPIIEQEGEAVPEDLVITYRGAKISFQPFDLKDANLRKIRTSLDRECVEGLWAWLRDQDLSMYDEDYPEGTLIVVLANDPVSLPFPAWKSYVAVDLRGEERPECDFTRMIGDPIFHHSKEGQ